MSETSGNTETGTTTKMMSANKNDKLAQWLVALNKQRENLPFGDIKMYRNEEGALHRDEGPASISPTRIIHYINGRKHGLDADIHGHIMYYYENIQVPRKYMLNPEELTVEEVMKHPNQEVKYVGMKVLGPEKLMEKAEIIHKDPAKNQILFKVPGIFTEPVAYIQVINSTAELDGTFKKYYLCVPPTMKTCKDAVAWTFGKDGATYNPTQET